MSKLQKTLDQLETQLRAMVEGSADKVFPSSNMRDDLAARLVSAMHNEIKHTPNGIQIAPNLYTLLLPPNQALAFHENQVILDEVAKSLEDYALEAGLHLDGKLILKVVPLHPDSGSKLRVLASFSQTQLGETSQIDVAPSPATYTVPPGAFMIVDSMHIIPLDDTVINIGRGDDNDLVIGDLHVSREHAQLRAIRGSYTIFDLNSSGGTFVNGERINHKELIPGDLITLATVSLIYGQEQPPRIEETQDLSDLSIRDIREDR